jgi:tetratricopeptide (TPR) repeat protein
MNKEKKQIINYLENANVFILGVFLFFFPLFFLSITTDPFILPKQILLCATVILSVLLFSIKTIIEGKIKFRSTPFDLPIILLTLAALGSAIFSVNQADALTAFMFFLFVILLYFVIINTVTQTNTLLFIITALVLGATLSTLLATLSYFKIYPLPFSYTHVTYFNTFGSLLDQAIYYLLVLPIAGYFLYSIFSGLASKRKKPDVFKSNKDAPESPISAQSIAFAVAFFIILAGLTITVYQLFTTQKPLILPIETGFQSAFASISQDSNRTFLSFLFGSGLNTYATDFTRFKSVAYNLNPTLWSFTFFHSSSFILELLATTGILGLLSFLFLIFKIIKEKNFFIPLILAIILSLVLPLSFTIIILFISLLGIFAAIRIHNKSEKFADVELYFVALRKGLIAAKTEGESIPQNQTEKKYSKLLPLFLFLILVLLTGFPAFFAVKYFTSDLLYQQAIAAYQQNDRLQTYQLQLKSINTFPYRDMYYRGLSQVNLEMANILALQAQNNSSESAQIQQSIAPLVQQAITSGRNATTISPLTSSNWNNLSTIYRSLIGYGENADKFAIQASQQAIALDPNNPAQYIELGGIYYQLGLYDDSIRQFQTAINLKNDYANAYYNLGHALEAKGNLEEALNVYKVVQTLVVKDQNNLNKINGEIQALQTRITQQKAQNTDQQTSASNSADLNQENKQQEPLKINQPNTKLPEKKPEVKIPGPTVVITPTEKPAAKPTKTTN